MVFVPRTASVKAFVWSLTILSVVLYAACSRDPQHILARGTKFVASGKYTEAVIELKNAVKVAPGLAEAHYQLGLAYAGLGQLGDSRREFETAVQLNPGNKWAQLYYGNFQLLDRKFEDARSRAELILKDDRSQVEALILLGNSYAGIISLNAAIKDLQHAFEAEPKLLPPYLDLTGDSTFHAQLELAEQAYNQAIAIANRSVEAYLAMGNFYLHTKRTQQAEEQFRAALAIEPQSRDANEALGAFYMETGKVDLAEQLYIQLANRKREDLFVLSDFYLRIKKTPKSVEVLEKVLNEDSQNLTAKHRLAAIFFSESNFEKAASISDEILKQAPTDADALLMKGRILLAQDKPGEAAVALQKHAKIRPRFASGRYFLGLAAVQTRDLRTAESEFVNAIKSDSTFFRAHLSLAEIKLNSGDANEAIRYGREALTRGNLDDAHLVLSRAYTSIGDFQNAAHEVDAFLRKRPSNAVGLYHLGLLKQAQGRFSEATAHFEASLAADPQNTASLEALSNLYLHHNQPEKAIDRIN